MKNFILQHRTEIICVAVGLAVLGGFYWQHRESERAKQRILNELGYAERVRETDRMFDNIRREREEEWQRTQEQWHREDAQRGVVYVPTPRSNEPAGWQIPIGSGLDQIEQERRQNQRDFDRYVDDLRRDVSTSWQLYGIESAIRAGNRWRY